MEKLHLSQVYGDNVLKYHDNIEKEQRDNNIFNSTQLIGVENEFLDNKTSDPNNVYNNTLSKTLTSEHIEEPLTAVPKKIFAKPRPSLLASFDPLFSKTLPSANCSINLCSICEDKESLSDQLLNLHMTEENKNISLSSDDTNKLIKVGNQSFDNRKSYSDHESSLNVNANPTLNSENILELSSLDSNSKREKHVSDNPSFEDLNNFNSETFEHEDLNLIKKNFEEYSKADISGKKLENDVTKNDIDKDPLKVKIFEEIDESQELQLLLQKNKDTELELQFLKDMLLKKQDHIAQLESQIHTYREIMEGYKGYEKLSKDNAIIIKNLETLFLSILLYCLYYTTSSKRI